MSHSNDDAIAGCFGITIIIMLLCVFMCTQFIGCDAVYSDGFRDGNVQKFSYRGLIVKSWEGELALPGFRPAGTDGAISNVFAFSVTDDTIIKQLQELPPEAHVRLHYREVVLNAHMYHSTPYRITKVEVLNHK